MCRYSNVNVTDKFAPESTDKKGRTVVYPESIGKKFRQVARKQGFLKFYFLSLLAHVIETILGHPTHVTTHQ